MKARLDRETVIRCFLIGKQIGKEEVASRIPEAVSKPQRPY
jgi:hypothetical protein